MMLSRRKLLGLIGLAPLVPLALKLEKPKPAEIEIGGYFIPKEFEGTIREMIVNAHNAGARVDVFVNYVKP